MADLGAQVGLEVVECSELDRDVVRLDAGRGRDARSQRRLVGSVEAAASVLDDDDLVRAEQLDG